MLNSAKFISLYFKQFAKTFFFFGCCIGPNCAKLLSNLEIVMDQKNISLIESLIRIEKEKSQYIKAQ